MTKTNQNKTLNIFFDVDGTLIDKDDVIRPLVGECLQALSLRGFNIHVWSGGGEQYASQQINRIINYYRYHNNEDLDIKYTIVPKDYQYIKIDKHSFAIDDMDEVIYQFIKAGGYGYKVRFYESNLMPDDGEMRDVYHAIMARYRSLHARAIPATK